MAIQLSPLVNMGVVVPDAEEAYRMLHRIFDARKIQESYADFLSSDQARMLHVGIGDVVLRFIEPIAEKGPWYSHLKQKGSGIHHLTYTVNDIDTAIETVTGSGRIDTLFTYDMDWEALIGSDYTNPKAKTIHVMDTMDKLGFHLEDGQAPADKGKGGTMNWLFTDFRKD